MKKTILLLLESILLAGLLIAVAVINPQKTFAQNEAGQSASLLAYTPDQSVQEDRVIALRKVLERNNSPLVGQAENFVKYADKYGVDWKLLPSISGLESSFGVHLMPNSYNAYGWGGGLIYFNSWEDGINTINKTLKANYMDKWGARDVWEIGPIYAESPTWAIRVSSIMEQINKEYIEIKSKNLTPTI